MKATTNYEDSFGAMVLQKINRLSQLLEIDSSELSLWMEQFESAGTQSILGMLHLACIHRLDPLLGEVSIWPGEQEPYPSITMDGWMKLINQHPSFMGVEFKEGLSQDSTNLEYIECTIYRSDRTIPIRVREYLDEVKADHPQWKTMPRRMLRHRALQQCARLAFGISTPETPSTLGKPNLNSKTSNGTQKMEEASYDKKSSNPPHAIPNGATKTSAPPDKQSRTQAVKQKLSHHAS